MSYSFFGRNFPNFASINHSKRTTNLTAPLPRTKQATPDSEERKASRPQKVSTLERNFHQNQFNIINFFTN